MAPPLTSARMDGHPTPGPRERERWISLYRKFGALLVAGVVLTVAVACGTPAANANLSATWATVNGEKITGQMVQDRINLITFLQPTAASQLKSHSAKVQLTDELVTETVLTQAAKKAGTKVNQSDLAGAEGYLTQDIGQTYKSTSAVKSAMKKYGLTQADVTAYAKLSALLQAYVTNVIPAPTVTTAQEQAYYNQNKAEFTTPAQYTVRHILVKSQTLAESILAKLKAGASFSTLAKEYSVDKASAAQGGDLPPSPLSGWVAPFAAAVQKLKVGELSPVVHSQYGYHIIQLMSVTPASVESFSTVQTQIQSYLQNQAQTTAVNKLISNLKSKAKIKVTVPKNA